MKKTKAVQKYLSHQARLRAQKRMEKLTPEQRSEIARLGAKARWDKAKKSFPQVDLQ
jgi:hypothetical protein